MSDEENPHAPGMYSDQDYYDSTDDLRGPEPSEPPWNCWTCEDTGHTGDGEPCDCPASPTWVEPVNLIHPWRPRSMAVESPF